jgi:hypothetical protein
MQRDLVQLTLEHLKEVVTDSSRTKKLLQLPSIQALLKSPSVSY